MSQFTPDPVATTVLPKDVIQKLEDFGSRVMKDEVAIYRKRECNTLLLPYFFLNSV